MWENDYKKTVIRNIILAVLTVLVIVFLAIAMREVSINRAQRDRALSEVSTQRQEEQNANIQDALDAVLAEYEKDVEAIGEYMPGIVCWGDVLTAGSSGNVSYPDVLQDYINEQICDKYDFEKNILGSISSTSMYSSLDWNSYKVSIPVVNMGSGEENPDTVLGRAGVRPYVVSKDFEIPEDTTPVTIKFTSPEGNTVEPLTSGNVGVNNVLINGIEGSISIDTSVYYDKKEREYYFTRAESGSAVEIKAGTEIVTAAADEYKDYIHVIWIGTYGKNSVQEIVDKTKELVARQSLNSGRFIVIGPCSYHGSWDYNVTNALDALDTALAQEFGNNYINLRRYLCSDGLSDAGITATSKDSRNISNGTVPASFRSSSGTLEFNARAYNLIGKLVFDRMVKLGFFNEICEELEIN